MCNIAVFEFQTEFLSNLNQSFYQVSFEIVNPRSLNPKWNIVEWNVKILLFAMHFGTFKTK